VKGGKKGRPRPRFFSAPEINKNFVPPGVGEQREGRLRGGREKGKKGEGDGMCSCRKGPVVLVARRGGKGGRKELVTEEGEG